MSGPSGPGATVSAREQSHRRRVLFGIALLLLLGMSPILGHHLGGRVDTLLAGRDHLGPLCLIALHEILEPVHLFFHVLLVVGLVFGISDRLRARWQTRALLSVLPAAEPGPGSPVAVVAAALGLRPGTIRVVNGLPVPAFTVGWLRPRIYLAGELEASLDPRELGAVIAHEAAHARRRDPLRLSALRFVSCLLFWIPALARLAQDCADEAEILADDASRQDPLALASALVSLAGWRAVAPAPGAHVGFQERGLLQRRVRRLAGEEVAPRTHVGRGALLFAGGMLAIVWCTGVVMAHPMPAPGTAHHRCLQDAGSAWSHLLCPHDPQHLCSHRSS